MQEPLQDLIDLLERSKNPAPTTVHSLKSLQKTISLSTIGLSFSLDKPHFEDSLQYTAGYGSGILITPSGYFLSNAHVVNGNQKDVIATILNGPNNILMHTKVSKILFKSETYDLSLGLVHFPDSVKSRLASYTPLYISTQRSKVHDSVFAYAFKDNKVMRSGGKVIAPISSRMISASSIKERKLYSATCECNYASFPGWSGGPVMFKKNGFLAGLTYAGTTKSLKFEESSDYISSEKIIDLLSRYVALRQDKSWSKYDAPPSSSNTSDLYDSLFNNFGDDLNSLFDGFDLNNVLDGFKNIFNSNKKKKK